MLYLTRKIGDSIIINDDIEVRVVDVRGKSVKLGLTFPEDVSVYRHEVYERIQAEKAGEAAPDGDAADNSSETTAGTTSETTVGTTSETAQETADAPAAKPIDGPAE